MSLATGGHEGIDLLTSLGLLGNHDNGAMYCPGNCPSSNKALCMTNGKLCSHGQYCHVFMDKTHTIHGKDFFEYYLSQRLENCNAPSLAHYLTDE